MGLIKNLIKFGLPSSYLYCTIYKQQVWREGDETLIREQAESWRKLINFVDTSCYKVYSRFTTSPQVETLTARVSLLDKWDAMDLRRCWNCKVISVFSSINQVASNPSIVACKLYRKIQPYVTTTSVHIETPATPKVSE